MAVVQSEKAASQRRRWGNTQDWSRLAALPRPFLAVRGRITGSVVRPHGMVYGWFGPHRHALPVILPAGYPEPDFGVERVYVGRLRYSAAFRFFDYELDTTASRFHGASIAGLIVGAMGVFVFTVALRHWLGERGRFREGTEGA